MAKKRGAPTIAAQSNRAHEAYAIERAKQPRPPARVITPEPEPWEPTHLLDARFTDGSRVRLRLRLHTFDGNLCAYSREEWEAHKPPGQVVWQYIGHGWLCGGERPRSSAGAPLAAIKLRLLDPPPARMRAQFTASVLVRCTPEQAERWKRAAEADPDADGNGQDFMRRALDEAAAFALSREPDADAIGVAAAHRARDEGREGSGSWSCVCGACVKVRPNWKRWLP